MKQTAERIFRETLAAIDIPAALEKALARSGTRIRAGDCVINLCDHKEIVAIALGKAAFAMAQGLAGILAPDFAPDGILVVPAAPARELSGWKTFVGGHPIPDEKSFAAGRATLDLLSRCGEETLIFFLISGGGSALMEQPLDPALTLADFQKLNSALVTCGASIEQINVIRKHLSATKGGRLAAAAPRSMKVTFAISDVPPGEESALASGPTLPDPSTVQDAQEIARKYNLLSQFPATVRAAFERGLAETPKAGDSAFLRSRFELLLSSHELLHAAHRACEAEGYVCLCDNLTDGWPIEKAADHLLKLLESQKMANRRPVAVLADGEVSSPVTGNGIGGRNSAFVLACVRKIADRGITVLSAGTDGIDGNSPAAGTIADGDTLGRALALGIDPDEFRRRSDAYNFFKRLGDAVITGPTGNNLRDLRILLMA
jgi:hydroxypyruvate reductase